MKILFFVLFLTVSNAAKSKAECSNCSPCSHSAVIATKDTLSHLKSLESPKFNSLLSTLDKSKLKLSPNFIVKLEQLLMNSMPNLLEFPVTDQVAVWIQWIKNMHWNEQELKLINFKIQKLMSDTADICPIKNCDLSVPSRIIRLSKRSLGLILLKQIVRLIISLVIVAAAYSFCSGYVEFGHDIERDLLSSGSSSHDSSITSNDEDKERVRGYFSTVRN